MSDLTTSVSNMNISVDAIPSNILHSPILELICGYLNHIDLCTISQINKYFYTISNQSYLWHTLYNYRFESEDKSQPIAKYMENAARLANLNVYAPSNSILQQQEQQATEKEYVLYKRTLDKFNWKKLYRERSQYDRLIIDVKPIDIDTDLHKLQSVIQSIHISSIHNPNEIKWGNVQILPIAYGLQKLRMELDISKTIQFEQIEELILSQKDVKELISSVDMVALRKVCTPLIYGLVTN